MLNHTIFNERPECQDRLIKFLVNMGYDYVSRSDAENKRKSLAKVIFEDELIRFLKTQTYKYKNQEYHFAGESIMKAIRGLDVPLLQGLMQSSKEIYHMLTLGVSIEETIVIDSDVPVKQSFDLSFIDFDNPHNNIWQVTEEFSVERSNGSYARPDVVLLVNGIPLVVIECKKSSVDVSEGVMQNIRNMKPDYIPQLFKFAQIILAMNPNEALYGTCGSTKKFFIEWKEENTDWQNEICIKCSPNGEILEQDRTTASLLDKKRLLDIVKHFILYDNGIKKITRHQQYFAIHKAMDRINHKDDCEQDGGVIWHTQGSGKSLTMVMLVKMIQSEKSIQNPRFLMVTDRVSLDKQIRDNFANTAMQPTRASTGKALKALLQDKSNTLITTLIHKFETVCKNKYLDIDSDKFYVFVDEAHRSQSNSMHNYMKEVLPNATIIAFTGTPLIANKKKSTYAKFGAKIHNYTMKRAIEDKIIVPLVYEGRIVVQNDPSLKIDDYFESMTKDLPSEHKEQLKAKFSKFRKLAEAKSRLDMIALDIANHFTEYCIPKGQKAMVACSSRAAAVEIFNSLKKLNNADINPAVVITFGDKAEGNNDDETSTAIKMINEYQNNYVKPNFGDNIDSYDTSICDRFTNPDGDVNIILVKDKLLTGFDAPIAGVLYIDKSMKEHSLLQAIARVNRVYDEKEFGLIVDYWGVFTNLKSAIDMYDDAESGFNKFDQEDIEDAILGPLDQKNKLETARNELHNMFIDLPKKATANQYQESLKEEGKRKEFYEKFKIFGKLLDLALANYSIFVAIGIEQLNEYKSDYSFYKKLCESVANRYDDKPDFLKYEEGLKALIDTFVHAEDVKTVVQPVSIMDEKSMSELFEQFDSAGAKADVIKTRMESKLQQIRYDDPLLFEKFSTKIKNTLAEYAQTRDDDTYFKNMEQMAKDFREGFTSQDYPTSIINDNDSKAFYGVFITVINKKLPDVNISLEAEEKCATYAQIIKDSVLQNTKRDWKHNEMAHKAIHRELDDKLFEMFEELNITIDKTNVEVIDLLIDEIMKVAVARF